MSVETPKVEETTPVVTKSVENTTIPAETSAPATSEPATTVPAVEPAIQSTETAEPAKEDAVEPSNNEAVVTAVPATEGILGYKGAPGLLNKFRFVKNFFWFSDEPLSQEGVDAYIKSEKGELAHHNAAWAQETGRGVLFYAKRAEDKATPSGIILVAEAGGVTRIGSTDFSFKVGNHTHKFEAASSQEQDSWVVAIEKIVQESKELKADITGRESYKKTIEGFAFSPIVAGSAAATSTKTETPKKSLDATTATSTAAAEPAVKADTSSESSADAAAKKDKEAEKQAKKDAKKERSQSRKRSSVFGFFGKKEDEKEEKKEEKAEKKEEKKEEKAEKKAEKEHAKEVKKAEAEQKKEEAKAEHDASKAKEAAEAAAVAAAPAAVAAAVEKKEEKHNETPADETASPVTSPTEKKNKRASMFGGFFGNKNKVTSPSAEKTEKETAPEVPAKDDTPVVSETAPRLEEPIDNKPIDTAAVTAPVDAVAAEPAVAPVAAEETKPVEPVAAPESANTPKAEKKGFFAGLMKKQEKKEEPKEEKTNEEAAKEVAPVAAAPETTAEPTPAAAATEPAVETPVKDAEAPKEERPAREKRRTSLFGSLGTLKRKTDKSPEPSSVAATEDAKNPEIKREKSPLPSKLGGLFRKPSRSAKTELSTADEAKTETAPATDAVKTDDTPAVTAESETPANATIIEHTGDSKIIGDVIPADLAAHSTVHDAVTNGPEATKTAA